LTLAEEVLDPMDVVQLNEHFRSQFELIEFSNRQFYSSKLDILTKRPLSMVKNAEFVQTKGRRLRSINQDEIDQILADVKKTIDKEHDLADQYKSTIGILSPFRKQVDKIISLLHKELTLEQLVAHKILVGTAFTFQGNERDVMYLSMVLDNKSLAGSFNFLNRKDVFNVSVTRARNKQIIYYSFNPEKLSPKSTLASFFDFYSRDREELKGRNTKDRFCDEVEQFMKELGCKSWRSFEISGVTIDLLVAKDNAYYGIDLIGFPGEMEDYYSLERYKTLERGKVKLFPLSYILWSKQEDKCKAALGDLVK